LDFFFLFKINYTKQKRYTINSILFYFILFFFCVCTRNFLIFLIYLIYVTLILIEKIKVLLIILLINLTIYKLLES